MHVAFALWMVAALPGDEAVEPLAMARAIPCRSITSYDEFVPLDAPDGIADEKLLFYVRPEHFTVRREKSDYRVRLTVDGVVRRRGQKAILRKKVDSVVYDARFSEPSVRVCINHALSLKGLGRGDYELELTLHDRLATPDRVAVQVIPFRVIAGPKVDPDAKPARPTGP